MKREFVVEFIGQRIAFQWAVMWKECDGRVVAYCAHRYEADEIASLLNRHGSAAKWYRRAKTALAMGAGEKSGAT